MFARFPLQASPSNDRLSRLADWWPAALLGVVALLTAVPESSAETLLRML